MEEEGIKSALELAMERISRLPELTPEEKAEQKEREYGPIGTAIAVKYMGGTLAAAELPSELKKYEGNQQRIIRRTLAAILCRELRLDNTRETAKRALNGIAQMAQEKGNFFEEAEENYLQILGEFEEARKTMLRQFEASAIESIKDFGISGSAIRPNFNENEDWRQELDRVRQQYEPRLAHVRGFLMKELQA